jgi:hypothetical protein
MVEHLADGLADHRQLATAAGAGLMLKPAALFKAAAIAVGAA